jgi:GAF domain-containing protein
VRTYRSPRTLVAEIENLLASNKPSFQHSPLEDVIELLCRGRHYAWAGIYLTVDQSGSQQFLGAGGDVEPAHVALPEARSKILISIKLASQELGVLAVESDRDNVFGREDRVLLETVANLLARFLAGNGKYLVRRARQVSSENSNPKRTPQPVATQPLRSAAVGEK